ncbi:hypothetical protein TWF730_007430 [Orbilia blumenaviensis]|uniref:SNTX MACPF/CDC-like domain-containing protein n=1 Tax=Orbilia blumenaviensis TaxID=1796055 RepID=A0AAV9VE72_9PEZI
MADVIRRPAFGEDGIELGRLYDAISDRFTLKNLFEQSNDFTHQIPPNSILTVDKVSTELKFSQSDDYQDKFQNMGVPISVGASFLARFFGVSGSGLHLDEDGRIDDSPCLCTMYCTTTTIEESLDFSLQAIKESLRNHTGTISSRLATHVVTSITWGTQYTITARRRPSADSEGGEEEMLETSNTLKLFLKRLEGSVIQRQQSDEPPDFDIEGYEDITITAVGSTHAKRYPDGGSRTGHVVLGGSPTTTDLSTFLANISKYKFGGDGGKGVQIMYTLMPLQFLANIRLIKVDGTIKYKEPPAALLEGYFVLFQSIRNLRKRYAGYQRELQKSQDSVSAVRDARSRYTPWNALERFALSMKDEFGGFLYGVRSGESQYIEEGRSSLAKGHNDLSRIEREMDALEQGLKGTQDFGDAVESESENPEHNSTGIEAIQYIAPEEQQSIIESSLVIPVMIRDEPDAEATTAADRDETDDEAIAATDRDETDDEAFATLDSDKSEDEASAAINKGADRKGSKQQDLIRKASVFVLKPPAKKLDNLLVVSPEIPTPGIINQTPQSGPHTPDIPESLDQNFSTQGVMRHRYFIDDIPGPCSEMNYEKPLERFAVKLACPSPECSMFQPDSWVCSRCCRSIQSCQINDLFYCRCGSHALDQWEMRCNSPKHGPEWLRYPVNTLKEMLGIPTTIPKDEQNILILGEAGAGKSTWINAFANYLSYDTLNDALDNISAGGEPIWPVPGFFKDQAESPEGEIVEAIFDIGHPEDIKHPNGAVYSRTCKTKVYVKDIQDTRIRFIDTPGIDNTKVFDEKNEYIEEIFQILGGYDKIHGILILVKPDDLWTRESLPLGFKFCLGQLFVNLPRTAMKNIVFGFTHASEISYDLGKRFRPLRRHARQSFRMSLRKRKVFYFESNSFRFLMMDYRDTNLEKDSSTSRRRDVRRVNRSWKHSVDECCRLLDHFNQLDPFDTSSILKIIASRETVVRIDRFPLYICQEVRRIDEVSGRLHQQLQVMEVRLLRLKMALDFGEKDKAREKQRSYPQSTSNRHLKRLSSSSGRRPRPVSRDMCSWNCTAGHGAEKAPESREARLSMERAEGIVICTARCELDNLTIKLEQCQAERDKLEREKEEKDKERLIIANTQHQFGAFLGTNAMLKYNGMAYQYLRMQLNDSRKSLFMGGHKNGTGSPATGRRQMESPGSSVKAFRTMPSTLESERNVKSRSLVQAGVRHQRACHAIDTAIALGKRSETVLGYRDLAQRVDELYALPVYGNSIREVLSGKAELAEDNNNWDLSPEPPLILRRVNADKS